MEFKDTHHYFPALSAPHRLNEYAKFTPFRIEYICDDYRLALVTLKYRLIRRYVRPYLRGSLCQTIDNEYLAKKILRELVMDDPYCDGCSYYPDEINSYPSLYEYYMILSSKIKTNAYHMCSNATMRVKYAAFDHNKIDLPVYHGIANEYCNPKAAHFCLLQGCEFIENEEMSPTEEMFRDGLLLNNLSNYPELCSGCPDKVSPGSILPRKKVEEYIAQNKADLMKIKEMLQDKELVKRNIEFLESTQVGQDNILTIPPNSISAILCKKPILMQFTHMMPIPFIVGPNEVLDCPLSMNPEEVTLFSKILNFHYKFIYYYKDVIIVKRNGLYGEKLNNFIKK